MTRLCLTSLALLVLALLPCAAFAQGVPVAPAISPVGAPGPLGPGAFAPAPPLTESPPFTESAPSTLSS